MIVALGVFIYSAYQLTLIYIESKESMEVYDEVTERTEGSIAPENRKGPTAFAVRPCTFWLPGTDLNRQPSD